MKKMFLLVLLALSGLVLAESGSIVFSALSSVLVGIPASFTAVSNVSVNSSVFLCSSGVVSSSFCALMTANDSSSAWFQLSGMTGNASSCRFEFVYSNSSVLGDLTNGQNVSFVSSVGTGYGVKVTRLVGASQVGSCSWNSTHN